MTLNLTDLRKPLEDVRFPNGVVHQPKPFGPHEYQLWRDMQSETDGKKAGMMIIEIIRACYPTVTDADLLDCTADELLMCAAHAGKKIEQIQHALKNGAPAAEAASPPPEVATAPSSPKTSGATSSPKSRGRSGKTGGPSTTASLTASPT